jgi:carbon storage regulator
MLVLSRKKNETICLGEHIEITIIRVAGDRVRLGIKAPEHMVILRRELEESKTFPPPDAREPGQRASGERAPGKREAA